MTRILSAARGYSLRYPLQVEQYRGIESFDLKPHFGGNVGRHLAVHHEAGLLWHRIHLFWIQHEFFPAHVG
jgi:hypothetical protein